MHLTQKMKDEINLLAIEDLMDAESVSEVLAVLDIRQILKERGEESTLTSAYKLYDSVADDILKKSLKPGMQFCEINEIKISYDTLDYIKGRLKC